MEKDLSTKLIEQLEIVRDEYIKMKNELEVSIRKDNLKVELKDILKNNTDYESLYKALNNYINKII